MNKDVAFSSLTQYQSPMISDPSLTITGYASASFFFFLLFSSFLLSSTLLHDEKNVTINQMLFIAKDTRNAVRGWLKLFWSYISVPNSGFGDLRVDTYVLGISNALMGYIWSDST